MLEKHMQRVHPKIKLNDSTSADLTMLQKWVTKGNIVADLCIDIAISGTPFSFFDKPQVRALTSLAMKGAGLKHEELNSEKIRKGVIAKAEKLRGLLKAKLKGRKVSLSSDFGSRHGVNFFCKKT